MTHQIDEHVFESGFDRLHAQTRVRGGLFERVFQCRRELEDDRHVFPAYQAVLDHPDPREGR